MTIRLNIGGGSDLKLEGFELIDRCVGKEAFPLEYADGTVDEVYASHVLEHIPRGKQYEAIAEWVRVLKPGGRLRIAVPDFYEISKKYVEGTPYELTEAYIFGGGTDENDHHHAGFDEWSLQHAMQKCGLYGVRRFQSEHADCSSLPISLNLEGYKPKPSAPLNTRAALAMTFPRLGFTDTTSLCLKTVGNLGLDNVIYQGAYFDQGMEKAISELMKDREFVITLDYDTLFNKSDVETLVALMDAHPDVGAIAGMQLRRHSNSALVNMKEVPKNPMTYELLDVESMHFGLTIIRTEVLNKIPRPWLHHVPGKNGWDETHIDADVAFWQKVKDTGCRICVSPRVNLGHLQLMATFVGLDGRPRYQHVEDFNSQGRPKGT